MTQTVYHPTTPRLAAWRSALAPEAEQAFEEFSKAVFADGALPVKTKQLIAVADRPVSHTPGTGTRSWPTVVKRHALPSTDWDGSAGRRSAIVVA